MAKRMQERLSAESLTRKFGGRRVRVTEYWGKSKTRRHVGVCDEFKNIGKGMCVLHLKSRRRFALVPYRLTAKSVEGSVGSVRRLVQLV